MAQKARNASTMSISRIYSDERSGEDKCGNSVPSIESRACPKKSLYHRYG